MMDRYRIGTSEAAKRIELASLAFLATRAAEADTVKAWVARQRAVWAERQPEVSVSSFTAAWRRILDEVCASHKVHAADVLSAARSEDLTAPRFEACYRIYAETTLSLSMIGNRLNRDHATVLHAIRSHARRNGLEMPRQGEEALPAAIIDQPLEGTF